MSRNKSIVQFLTLLAALGLGEVSPAIAAPSAADEAHNAGVEDYRAGDLPAAEKKFREAVSLDDQTLLYRNDLALLLMEQGRVSEALAHYQYAALKLAPKDADARHRYAIALNAARQVAEAAKQLEEVLKLDPRKRIAPAI